MPPRPSETENMPKRLRKWNDLAHAAAWLTEQTGVGWEALDLANAGSPHLLRLYVHLRWPPERPRPDELPQALAEGCMAEICFHNDLERLTQTDEFPLHMARLGEGDSAKHLLFNPGIPHTLDEIRVKESDLVAFLDKLKSSIKAAPIVSTRIAAIVETARRLEYDPKCVAYGGKAAIKRECTKNAKLFTDSTFDDAWKAASKAGLITVDNVETYRKR